jgi:hypothetical protein
VGHRLCDADRGLLQLGDASHFAGQNPGHDLPALVSEDVQASVEVVGCRVDVRRRTIPVDDVVLGH